MNDPTAPVPPFVTPPTPAAREANWLLFFVVLLTPAVLTVLSNHGKAQGFAVFSLFCLSPVAGIICAALVVPKNPSVVARVLLGIALAVGLSFVSFALCFAGCAATGR